MSLLKVLMPLSNLKIVLLSFLGATIFWLFSALGKSYNTRIKYPIHFVFDRDSLVLMQPLPEFVELDVTGGGWDLFRNSIWIGVDPVSFELDNPVSVKFLTRPTILPLVSDHLNQFQINFLYTDTIHIDIESKVSSLVLLEIDSLQISMEENYRIVSPISIWPDSAIIYGPTSFIDTLGKLLDVPVLANEIDREFDRFLTLGLPEGYNISSSPNSVKVMFSVERFDDLQMPIEVEMLNFPDDSSVIPELDRVNVNFVVQRSLEEEFFAEDFKVIVDYDMMNYEDSTAPAIIMIHPENALEVDVDPDTIKIKYSGG